MKGYFEAKNRGTLSSANQGGSEGNLPSDEDLDDSLLHDSSGPAFLIKHKKKGNSVTKKKKQVQQPEGAKDRSEGSNNGVTAQNEVTGYQTEGGEGWAQQVSRLENRSNENEIIESQGDALNYHY